ncbi:MAG: pyruvate dehydrogenase complex dihydrolipoamide acetyltransferase [Gemmatimonadota bacterium]
MATKVHMEALSPTMEEGQLVRWLKSEGDPVASGEILAEIETDKATMELVARGDGVLRKVLLPEGGTAPVGEVIALIAGEDEDISALVPESAGAEAEAPAPQAASPPEGAGRSSQAPVEAQEPPAPAAPSESTSAVAGAAEGAEEPSEKEAEPEDGRIRASPLARRMAREANLDLSRVKGSGPGGRVVKRDVESAREGGEAEAAAPAGEGPGAAPAPSRPVAGLPEDDFQDVPLSQMRKTIAKRLVESLGPVPHFFLRITVDMTRVLEARERVNRVLEAEGEKISINDFILRATAQALARHPEVNAHWKDGEAVRRHFRVHLGVAVAVEDGLITPVVRDANLKGLAQISREVRELAARGREKRLQPEEYTGSTFSVSNLGMFGIHEFTGVINPPEAGILAVGGIEQTPVVEDEDVVVRPLMKVTMSCDHRVVDGAMGARFLQTLKEMLEEPAAILI